MGEVVTFRGEGTNGYQRFRGGSLFARVGVRSENREKGSLRIEGLEGCRESDMWLSTRANAAEPFAELPGRGLSLAASPSGR